MELALETRSPSEARADVLVLGRYAAGARPARRDRRGGPGARRPALAVLASEKFEGKPGQLSYVHTGGRIPAERVLVVGLGPHRRRTGARDAEPMRRAAAAAVRRARDLGAATVAVFMPADGLPAARAGAGHRGGRAARHLSLRQVPEGEERQGGPRAHRARARPAQRGRRARRACGSGEIWAEATCLARDLVNEPANVVTPTFLARRADEIAREGGLTLEVLDRAECATHGHGRLRRRRAGQRGAAEVHPPHLHPEGPARAPASRSSARASRSTRAGSTSSPPTACCG